LYAASNSATVDTVMRFDRQAYGQRVVFGAGAARTRLGEEIDRLGAERVLLLAAPSARGVAEQLVPGLPIAGAVDEVRMHVPAHIADRARRRAADTRADLVLSIGGGSAIGTAKAIALTTGIPVLAVPTTYSGSEATPTWGITADGRKTTGADERVLPRTIIYDPELTAGLPPGLSVTSGFNALAHCVDALWGPRANPVTTTLALDGARVLGEGLALVRADPGGARGRELCLYGAYLAGLSLAGAGSGPHHTICHVLGGAYDLPHAATHAVVLPHVLARMAPGLPADEAARLATALGGDTDPTAALVTLGTRLGAPRSLRALGLSESALPSAAALIADAGFTLEDSERLLRAAWAGENPPGEPGPGEREAALTREVLASFANTPSPRMRQIAEALVRHSHAFLREIRPTEHEWQRGIDFLTATGHISDASRQEFVLLSDVLGLSMLTVAVNEPADPAATEATVLGPFFVRGSPHVPYGHDLAAGASGQPCWVEGTVTDTKGVPLPGARLEIWEADDEGHYDVQNPGAGTAGRGHQFTDEAGRYAFWCVTPAPYPIPGDGPVGALLDLTARSPMRPAHLHFLVTAPGHHRLVTHIFVRGGAHLRHDAVFGVKPSLIVDFAEQPPGTPAPGARPVEGTWTSARFDIVLATRP
jgi:maleylacetate reductase